MAIKILLADDERLVRYLIADILAKHSDLEVIGQAANGEEVMSAIRTTTPDVLLLDLNMPKMSGWDVLDCIRREALEVNVITLSMADDDKTISKALNAGALGFLPKSEEWDEMRTAILTVAKGEFYLSQRVNGILKNLVRGTEQVSRSYNDVVLDDRDLAVLQGLHNGQTSLEIAESLYCSRSNVDRIRQLLIHRAGATNTSGLLSYSLRNGWVK